MGIEDIRYNIINHNERKDEERYVNHVPTNNITSEEKEQTKGLNS
jgi:hypothetical protein